MSAIFNGPTVTGGCQMGLVKTRSAFRDFVRGIVVGVISTYCLFTLHSAISSVARKSSADQKIISSEKNSISLQVSDDEDDLSTAEDEVEWPVQKIISRKREGQPVASRLKKTVRILCWVMTSPENLETKAVHVNATWGPRCDVLLFMSSKPSEPVPNNLQLPVVELNVPEGRMNLWTKTKAAFKYIFMHHMNDADWFFKADDDTFAVMENMRYLLSDKDPDHPFYLGRRFNGYASQGYMSGGAGYVLSRAAVMKLGSELTKNPGFCRDSLAGVEDVLMGICMEKCGVEVMDTRDVLGRQTFHPLTPWDHLMSGRFPEDYWLSDYDYYPTEVGPKCCSNHTITFHYIPGDLMRLLDFLVYRMKPYGIARNCDQLNQ